MPVFSEEGTGFVDQKHLERNLDSLRAARERADIVVFSIHAHQQGRWLEEVSRLAIDNGADIVFAHGPHEVKGIEVYRGRPIFYCLGDFVFQNELVEKFPSEVYEQFGLDDTATPEDAIRVRTADGTRGFPAEREPWEGFLAQVRFVDGKVAEISLVPIDLGFGQSLPRRGRPELANPDLGRRMVLSVAAQSRRYGTAIVYDGERNVGIVRGAG